MTKKDRQKMIEAVREEVSATTREARIAVLEQRVQELEQWPDCLAAALSEAARRLT